MFTAHIQLSPVLIPTQEKLKEWLGVCPTILLEIEPHLLISYFILPQHLNDIVVFVEDYAGYFGVG